MHGAWAAANVLAVEESALILRRAKFDFFAETKPLLVDQELRKEFTSFFGDNEEVRIFRAPGRVNLIGEHIDYNGGLVMPAAINQHLYLTIRPRQDKKIILHNLNFSETFEQDLDLDLNETTWAKYLCAILKLFKDKGFNFKNGFEGFFYSQIPAGAGLSSSAALELAFSFAMDKFNDFGLSRIDLARFGQEAENKYVGVACGIMDQFSVAMGEKDQVITLNCSDLSFRTSPLHLGDYELLIIYSGKSRTLDGSKYNERLAECQKALEIVKKLRPEIKNLCSIKPDELEGLQEYFEDELLFSRLRHVVCEAWRVQESEKALKAGNLSLFGEYLKESHLSLKNNYQVSGEELDLLFELSKSFSGCLGARMTGAGFGGSFIALVHKDSSQNFSDSLKDRYWKLTGLKAQVFSSKASAGVCEL